MRRFPWTELGSAAAILVAALLLYVGSYYAMVRKEDMHIYGGTLTGPRYPSDALWVDYFYRPIYRIDRRVRHSHWGDAEWTR